MSIESAKEFIEAVGREPTLQRRVEGLEGKGVLAQLVELGQERGLAFTEEEYRTAVVELADGELSDEALDEVLRESGLKS